MNIQSAKLHIMQRILEMEDEDTLAQIKDLLDGNTEGWYENLPAEVQKSIEQGLKESENGEGISHELVRKEYSNRLKK